jgi:hypothetical protein
MATMSGANCYRVRDVVPLRPTLVTIIRRICGLA